MTNFSLPDFPEVSPEILRSIARRHGLDAHDLSVLPETGVFNAIYLLGEDYIQPPRRCGYLDGWSGWRRRRLGRSLGVSCTVTPGRRT